MSDLNRMISEIKKSHTELDDSIKKVLKKYEHLHHESNRQLFEERAASGSMKGLEDFYYMVQIIKRNKDVIGSLARGMANLRSLNDFKIIEENVPEAPSKKKPRKKQKQESKQNVLPEFSEAQEIETVIEEGLNG